jgi:omega-3 fatty acid desaturase (delta-15 desaturase)
MDGDNTQVKEELISILLIFLSFHRHHEHHNDVNNDHSWRPVPRRDYLHFKNATDVVSRISWFIRFTYAHLFIYPVYLLLDAELASGNHFNPWSRLFAKEERRGAAISAIAVATWVSVLVYWFPFTTLLDAYFAPYFFFVFWLDLVTWLQHTHCDLEYYRDEAWTFLKGGLMTMDRSYGRVIDHLHHDIGTHVVHHLFFSKIPHYALKKATKAVKPMLGDRYKYDETPVIEAYFKSFNQCKFVPDGKTVKYMSEDDLQQEEQSK